MATRHVHDLQKGARPDTTGECYEEPYGITDTNGVWSDMPVVRFGASAGAAPTVRHGFQGQIRVPDDYDNGGDIELVWTSPITSGDVVWDAQCREVAGNDTTSLDQSGTQASVTATDTAPGATDRRMTTTLALGLTLTPGATLEFGIYRDGADAADTMAGPAILLSASLVYADA